MADLINYTKCPCCNSNNISRALACRDYTVSRETFEVWHCSDCTLRFTQRVPGAGSIGKYYQSENYISHSDTGQGMINKLYKLARRFTLSQKRKLVTATTRLSSGNLLDIGCGTGAFLNEMKRAQWQVTGLEPDAGAREKAGELYGLNPQEASALFKLAPGQFNAITLWHVLEHVHDLHGYLEQFRELLADKGKVFIAVPNYTSADAAYYGPYWAAYDVPRHLYHFSPMAMRSLAVSHGFRISNIKPMLLDAFYIAMLSEQYKNGKENLLPAIWKGITCTIATFRNTHKSSSLIYVLEK